MKLHGEKNRALTKSKALRCSALLLVKSSNRLSKQIALERLFFCKISFDLTFLVISAKRTIQKELNNVNSSRVWRRNSHFRMLFNFRNRTLHNLQHHCSTLETCYSAVGNDAGESKSSTRTCSVLCELKYSRAR